MTTTLAAETPEAPRASLLPPVQPSEAPPGASFAPVHVVPVGEFPDGSPRAAHFATPARSHVAGDTSLVSRSVATLHVHEAPGARVEVFASTIAPRAEKPSIFDPRFRQRPALEAPPSPDELAERIAADVSPAVLEAMKARASRSVLDPGAVRERALYDGLPTVPVIVRDPTPPTSWSSPTTAARLPARSRSALDPASVGPAALEPRGPTPCLYRRERP